MGNGFISAFRIIATKKRTIAWLTFVALATAPFAGTRFPDFTSQIFYGAALTFALALLMVVLEIHKTVTEPHLNAHANLDDAWAAMKSEISVALSKSSSKSVVWLGITLADAWPRLYGVLRERVKDSGLTGLTLDLYQGAPDYLRTLASYDQALAPRAEATRIDIDGFRNELECTGNKVNIYRYAYMPNLHGLLINGSILYISHVKWVKGRLDAAEQPYQRVDVSTSQGELQIELFNSWLEHARGKHSNEPGLPPK